MTVPTWRYHDDARLPGVTLARLSMNSTDPAGEGKALADEMNRRPPGQRGVLVTDLGGGSAHDRYHWFTRADGGAVSVEDAQVVCRTGARPGAIGAVMDWTNDALASYAAHNGPQIDFLAANVEAYPGAFGWNTEASFDQIEEWYGLEDNRDKPKQERIDYVQTRGSDECGERVDEVLNRWPATRRYNLGAVTLYFRDKNGQLVAPWYWFAAPYLYLTETHRAAAVTPASVLAHNLQVWEMQTGPKCAVLAPPDWGGEGDNASVPGCGRGKVFTFPDGTKRRFYTKPVTTWANEYRQLAEFILGDAGTTDIVLWHNDGRIFGPAPTDAACAVAREALA